MWTASGGSGWASWDVTAPVLEIFLDWCRSRTSQLNGGGNTDFYNMLEPDAAVHEQLGQDPMHDRGAHLGLDVVADDRQPALLEAAAPVRLPGDEHRNAVDEGAPGGQP